MYSFDTSNLSPARLDLGPGANLIKGNLVLKVRISLKDLDGALL